MSKASALLHLLCFDQALLEASVVRIAKHRAVAIAVDSNDGAQVLPEAVRVSSALPKVVQVAIQALRDKSSLTKRLLFEHPP